MKKFFALVLSVHILSVSFAQLTVDGGATVYFVNGKAPKDASIGSEAPIYSSQGGFIYPRFLINPKENTSFSVGMPLTFAFGGEINSRNGDANSLLFHLDLPLTFDYNIGLGALQNLGEDNKNFGAFVGAGFGFTSANSRYSYIDKNNVYKEVKVRSIGPLVHAGLRANLGGRGYFLRGAYKVGLDKLRLNNFYITVGTLFQ